MAEPTTSEPSTRARSSAPPEAWPALLSVARLVSKPLDRMLAIEAASGIVLFLAAAIALGLANSPWATHYAAVWHTPIGVRVGDFQFERSLEWIVNDGLMTIFFFVVGMEIRREIYKGELSDLRRASLPIAAALGGMLAPAGIYLLLTHDPSARAGWAIPMATDIAFALGVLTLLGQRVPPALRVLLLALAVIDDLGAIIVIALFYSPALVTSGLAVAALGCGSIFVLQGLGVRNKLAYIPSGIVAWAGVYSAGIHPTIAGVIVGLITPVRTWHGTEGYLVDAKRQLDQLERSDHSTLTPHRLAVQLHAINVARREALSPAESLIESLHPWVAFGIMPMFALANAGVSLAGIELEGAASSVAIGTMIGLIAGKPIGILLTCYLAIAVGLSALPKGLGPRHILILGMVAGIGFTMSLFIAQLAFDSPDLLGAAKLGVLLSSVVTAALGLTLGSALLKAHLPSDAAQSATEAEASTTL